MRRTGRSGLTREMSLPLQAEKVRSLSAENHLALTTVRGGRGDLDQVSCLMRVVHLAFYLRDATSTGADSDLYRRAEAALNACVTRVDQGEHCLLLDHELATGCRFWSRRFVAILARRLRERPSRSRPRRARTGRDRIALRACGAAVLTQA